MTAPIVVGMDLSESAVAALEEAIPIARRRGSEIVMVHVAPLPESPDHYPWIGGAMLERYRVAIVDELRQTREELEAIRERHRGQGVTLSHLIAAGAPEVGVAEAADKLSAGLIIVGTHGRTGLDHILLGSVAERVIRHTGRDVLVARGARKKGTYEHILVPTDFSRTAHEALAKAAELAAERSAITYLHCIRLPAGVAAYSISGVRLDEEVEANALARLRSDARALEERGIDVRLVVRHGDVAAEIRRLAFEHDLVVMGSHGRSGFRRLFLGSIAEKTIRHAPCSVYVARAARDAAEQHD